MLFVLAVRTVVRPIVRSVVPLALLASCAAWSLAAQSPSAGAGSALERTVDPAIRPGDDFFAYANGAWLKATLIPPGKQRWGPRDEISELTRQRLARLLDEARSAARSSAPRKVADFHAAWLNDAEIEARGRAPLQGQLDSIAAIADQAALTRLLGHRMRADVDPLNWGVYESATVLGLSVEESIHGETTNVAFLLQGGLGLGDRDLYLGTEPRHIALRNTYREYIAALLAFGGITHADERAAGVLALETEIARTHGTREQTANDRNADTVWSRADFARRAPGLDWAAYFASAGLAAQPTFVVWQPSAVAGVADLVAREPLEAWKDYLRFHVLADHAELLPRAVADRALALRAAVDGQTQPAPRAERAMQATQRAMSDAIGRMYAERHFPAAQRERVQRIVANVTAAFTKRVEGATWMAPATRAVALTKLQRLYVGIGYPDRWQDYTDLAIDPSDAMGNVRRVEERDRRRAIAKLGRPIDAKEWWIAPQAVGAILIFQLNTYQFTAALLQPPKFDPAASDAAAYGAIGAIIGHDVVHYVDVLGADYDVSGAMRRWWTPADSARYDTLSNALVQQFNGYRPLADAAVNGQLTARENIADLAGLAAAFDAYRLTLGAHATDTAAVRRPDREFFIAFAQGWRIKMNDAAMRAQLGTDHAPDLYRVSTVRNLDAWYDAFDVRPGQRLYLAPAARVKIW